MWPEIFVLNAFSKNPSVTSSLNLRIGDVHVTFDTGAMKTQRVTAPFAGEVILGSQGISRFLRQRLCPCKRQGMGSDEFYVGHAVLFIGVPSSCQA